MAQACALAGKMVRMFVPKAVHDGLLVEAV